MRGAVGAARSLAARETAPALVVVALSALMLRGCVSPITRSTVIDESTQSYVKLETRYDALPRDRPIRFSHPVRLETRDWNLLLEGIRVRPHRWLPLPGRPDPEPSPAFEEGDRQYLARHMATAFARAGDDQWVVFFLSRPREPGVTELTSGSVYVEDASVHLVLANYRQPASMSYAVQQTRDDPLHPLGEAFYDVVPEKYQTLRSDGRWHLGTPLAQDVVDVAIEYRSVLTTQEGSPASLEERFRTLERLRQQGLITDEEYRGTRQKLLDALSESDRHPAR